MDFFYRLPGLLWRCPRPYTGRDCKRVIKTPVR